MRCPLTLAWSVGLATALTACGSSPPPPTAPAPTPKPVAAATARPPQPAPPSVPPVPEVPAPPKPTYDAKGRRDPFENLDLVRKETGSGFTVGSAKLTGIIRGRTILALVETPEGMGYIMKPGDTLGDGRLVEIGPDSAVFTVVPKPGSNTNRVILRITPTE
jgi:type IV pilus assembly protein PilP